MKFSWDETKSRANLRKHGVSFEAAQLVFEDPLHLTRQDCIESGELRWQTIGMVNNMMLLLVAHTWIDGREQHIRIISARKASKSERRIYEQDP